MEWKEELVGSSLLLLNQLANPKEQKGEVVREREENPRYRQSVNGSCVPGLTLVEDSRSQLVRLQSETNGTEYFWDDKKPTSFIHTFKVGLLITLI